MPKSLKEIQEKLQAAILHGDKAILKDIKDNTKEQRETLLQVYQHAYGARLEEFLANDYPKTQSYLGENLFQKTAKAYYKNAPSTTPNARWFGQNFPAFCKKHTALKDKPEITELAQLEHALNTAFDAKDAPPFTQNDLTKIAPEQWGQLTFIAHPSITRLSQHTNASDIWSALSKEKNPPPVTTREKPKELLIWRGDQRARFRPLAYDEAMIWDEAVKGANFANLCEMLGIYWPEEEAPLKAATYLQSWLNSEWLAKP